MEQNGFRAVSPTFPSLADLDFRQLMKAIGGIRGQMSQLQVTVKEVSDNQGAVQQVAEVSRFPYGFLRFSSEVPVNSIPWK